MYNKGKSNITRGYYSSSEFDETVSGMKYNIVMYLSKMCGWGRKEPVNFNVPSNCKLHTWIWTHNCSAFSVC
jgi:hypothetical protein